MRTLRRGREELVQLVDVAAPSKVTEAGTPSAAGAPPDFEAFYRCEYPGLVVLAWVLTGPALAEDVAQEAMLEAHREWDAVLGHESPVGWVRAVCLRKAASVARRRTLERRLLQQAGAFRAEAAIAVVEDERFWQAVRSLPLKHAQAVALHYALDLSVVEVAETLGCAEGAVETHLSRARSALASTRSWAGGMSIDALARRVSEQTRVDVHGSLDVEERLGDLYVVRRRRRLAKATAGLAAGAVIGALTIGVLSFSHEAEVHPAGPARPIQVEEACRESVHVKCLDGSTILVRGDVPYTFTVPPGLSRDVSERAGGRRVDVFADGEQNGGVAIMSDVEPAGAATVRGADELARWVAARASLLTTPVTRGNHDGFDTWSVEASLSPKGMAMAASCNANQSSCRPVLEQTEPYQWQTGVSEGMVSRYTFLDVPGLGTVAVWSWVFPDEDVPWSYADTVLDRYERLANSLDFQAS
jgi:RNA polymerase sigma factor (sigma-70 family)